MFTKRFCIPFARHIRNEIMLKLFLILSMLLVLPVTGRAAASPTPGPNDRLTFCVIGDTQSLDDITEKLVARITAEKPDFVLIPGDCVSFPAPECWDKFFRIVAPLYSKPNTSLYAVPGNHDMQGLKSAEFDMAGAMKTWQSRWDLPGTELFYSFTKKNMVYVAGLMVYGNSLFRMNERPEGLKWLQWPYPVMDSKTDTQMDWLKRDLAGLSPTIKWRFIFEHYPGSRYGRNGNPWYGMPDPGVSAYVEPLAFEHGVDIIISGHFHWYERTYPINITTGRRDDARGLTMLITGGGNYSPYPFDLSEAAPMWFDAVVAVLRPHYDKVVIEGNRLTWQTIGIDGSVLDRFEITKSADGKRAWRGLPKKARFLK